MRCAIVIAPIKRQSIRGATRNQHFFSCHATAYLWQPHRVARHTRGIHSVGHCQFRVIGHDFGRLSQGFFKRIRWVVCVFYHALHFRNAPSKIKLCFTFAKLLPPEASPRKGPKFSDAPYGASQLSTDAHARGTFRQLKIKTTLEEFCHGLTL